MIRQVQERMDYLTWHDALTGLPNRLLLTDRLRQMLKICQCGAPGRRWCSTSNASGR